MSWPQGDEERTVYGKIMAIELLRGKPYTCPTFTLPKGKEKIKIEEKEAYLFDILKIDQIFYFLVKDKQIKLLEGHQLPPTSTTSGTIHIHIIRIIV